jgi:hypothetical protein
VRHFWIATLLCGTPLAAQQQPYAVLSGVVADSIHGGPLTGALVIVSGTDRQGIVDSTGRFRIDSIPPGDHELGVFHPLLDSLNVSVSSKNVALPAGVLTSVFMATPSAMTVVGIYCPEDQRKGGPAAVIGRVLAPDGDDPVPNAMVQYTVVSMPTTAAVARGALPVPTQFIQDTRVNTTGAFAICGLPVRAGGTVHASRGQIVTGEQHADVSKWLIALVTLRLDTLKHGTAIVVGRIVDDKGAPVAHADVDLANSRIKTATTDSGTFALRDLPAGSQTIQVRKVGFAATDTSLMLSSKTPVQFAMTLHTAPVTLGTVKVEGSREKALARVGFDHRRKVGLGHFLTADDVNNRGATWFSDLLRTTPGLQVRETRLGRQVIVASRGASISGRGCVAYVIDHVAFYDRPLGSIDDVVHPNDVIGVEVYQPSEAPADVVLSPNCVAIVIWTKATSGGD